MSASKDKKNEIPPKVSDKDKNDEFSFDDIPVLGKDKKKDEFSFEDLFEESGIGSDGHSSKDRHRGDRSVELFEQLLIKSGGGDKHGGRSSDSVSEKDSAKSDDVGVHIGESSQGKSVLNKLKANRKIILPTSALVVIVFLLSAFGLYRSHFRATPVDKPTQPGQTKADKTPATEQQANNQPLTPETNTNPPNLSSNSTPIAEESPLPVEEDIKSGEKNAMTAETLKQELSPADEMFYGGKYQEALELYLHYLQNKENEFHKKNTLLKCAVCLEKLNQYEQSEKYYTEALSLFPSDTEIYEKYVYMLSGEGRFDKAFEVVEQFKSNVPGNNKATNLEAELLFYKRNDAQSLELFKKSQKEEMNLTQLKIFASLLKKTQPETAKDIYLFAGKKFLDLASFEEAAKMFEAPSDKIRVLQTALKSIEKEDDKAMCLVMLAEAYFKSDTKEKALESLNEINLEKLSGEAIFRYISLITKIADPDKIRADITAIADKNLSNIELSEKIQDLLRAPEFRETKLDIYSEIRLKRKNDAESEYFYGRALPAHSKASINYFESAVKKNSLFVPAWFEIGKIAFRERKYARAEEVFRKCVEIYPFDLEYNRWLCDIGIRNGKGETSYNEFSTFINNKNMPYEKKLRELIHFAQKLSAPDKANEILAKMSEVSSMKKEYEIEKIKIGYIYNTLTDNDFANGYPPGAREYYILYCLAKGKNRNVLTLTTPPDIFPEFWKVFLCWLENIDGWQSIAEQFHEKRKKEPNPTMPIIASLWLGKLSTEGARELINEVPPDDEPLLYWMLAEKYRKELNQTKAKVCYQFALKDKSNILYNVIKFYSNR